MFDAYKVIDCCAAAAPSANCQVLIETYVIDDPKAFDIEHCTAAVMHRAGAATRSRIDGRDQVQRRSC
jgi:hypothetical protein